jgi:hypothetical protein
MKAAVFDATNPHFRSKYATLASCFEASKPAFENGLSVTQDLEVADGRVQVTTILMHSSGEWLESTVSLKPRADTPQDIGACATYGRRYGLSAILGLSSDDDDDGNSQSVPAKKADPKKDEPKTEKPADKPAEKTAEKPVEKKELPVDGKLVAEQIKAIRGKLADKFNADIDGMKSHLTGIIGRKVNHLTELNADERAKLLEVLK